MLYIKSNSNNKIVPVGIVLPPKGVDPSDTTATEEDVFAPTTFYAGSNEKKTGGLDPLLEYIKYDELMSYVERGWLQSTEQELEVQKYRVEMYLQRIYGGILLRRWLNG